MVKTLAIVILKGLPVSPEGTGMSLCLQQEEDRSHLAEEKTEVQTG